MSECNSLLKSINPFRLIHRIYIHYSLHSEFSEFVVTI
jgi:hypothetical protein